MAQGDAAKKLSGEATISRDAFVRAWSCGSLEEQGEMLFDLIGESLVSRMGMMEEGQRNHARRIENLEETNSHLKKHKDQMQLNIEKQFSRIEKKWAYIAGGVGVIAVLAGPVAAAIVTVFGSCG